MILLTALLIESTIKGSTCFFKILNYCDLVSSQHVIIIFLSNFLTYYGHKGLAEIVKTSHYYKKKAILVYHYQLETRSIPSFIILVAIRLFGSLRKTKYRPDNPISFRGNRQRFSFQGNEWSGFYKIQNGYSCFYWKSIAVNLGCHEILLYLC